MTYENHKPSNAFLTSIFEENYDDKVKTKVLETLPSPIKKKKRIPFKPHTSPKPRKDVEIQ